MAVAEMSVLTLVALEKDKSAILDELQKCGAAQIRTAKEYALTERGDAATTEHIASMRERVEKATAVIYAAAESRAEKGEAIGVKDGFGVTAAEFFAAGKNEGRITEILTAVEESEAKIAEIRSEMSAIAAKKTEYRAFLGIKQKFSELKDTAYTSVRIGTVAADKAENLSKAAESAGITTETYEKTGNFVAVVAVYFKADEKIAEDTLSSFAFKRFNDDGNYTAGEKIAELDFKADALRRREAELISAEAKCSGDIKDLKIYSDYLAFLGEKAEAEERFNKTETAFLLEAYVPTECIEKVNSAVKAVAETAVLEFKPVPRDEFAPTLSKNGKVVSNFEAVTNLYSAPAYNALDPNAVMSFFFSLFMGVIMADVGYGLLMLVGGLLFAKKQREGTTLYRMANVFAVGGIFACVFGALFDSWLGFALLRDYYFGKESAYYAFYEAHLNQITSMTSVAGINVPSILMWCLALGTAHIGVGLILKAVQSFSRGKYLDGLFGGIVWAVAMFALIFFVFGMATGNSALKTYGGYTAVIALAVGVITAGISEKGFGKIIKVFTSLYGLINYVSDILSYARLYGLMLSGAQIASIFTNTLAIKMLFPQGAAGKIAGVLLIIVGNLFNLAINLLGAYIHDARLQYVEFYGKFYEGEGELFSPFGLKREHLYFRAENALDR